MLICILLKSIKFIPDLNIDIFAFAPGLSAFGLDNPYRAIFFHDNVICMQKLTERDFRTER